MEPPWFTTLMENYIILAGINNDLRDSLWLFYDTLGKEIDRHAFRNDIETGLVY
jgi:hypothetical protein